MDPKLPIRATTQEQIPIEDINENLVILKNGSCCLILQVTALNFSLLSETEQEAIIYSYAALLNSLTFPIQILVKSTRKDISSYLKILLQAENDQNNPLLKNQVNKYRRFIEEMIKKNNVLDKKFYLVIPFFAIELGIKQTTSLNPFTSRKNTSLPFSKSYLIEKAKMSLYPRREHLIRQFARIGLYAWQLSTEELIALFHEIYNSEQVESQKISPEAQYTSYTVQSIDKIAP
jgi:hypothetical protein